MTYEVKATAGSGDGTNSSLLDSVSGTNNSLLDSVGGTNSSLLSSHRNRHSIKSASSHRHVAAVARHGHAAAGKLEEHKPILGRLPGGREVRSKIAHLWKDVAPAEPRRASAGHRATADPARKPLARASKRQNSATCPRPPHTYRKVQSRIAHLWKRGTSAVRSEPAEPRPCEPAVHAQKPTSAVGRQRAAVHTATHRRQALKPHNQAEQLATSTQSSFDADYTSVKSDFDADCTKVESSFDADYTRTDSAIKTLRLSSDTSGSEASRSQLDVSGVNESENRKPDEDLSVGLNRELRVVGPVVPTSERNYMLAMAGEHGFDWLQSKISEATGKHVTAMVTPVRRSLRLADHRGLMSGDRLATVEWPLGTPAAILDDLKDISPALREETVYVPNLDFETNSHQCVILASRSQPEVAGVDESENRKPEEDSSVGLNRELRELGPVVPTSERKYMLAMAGEHGFDRLQSKISEATGKHVTAMVTPVRRSLRLADHRGLMSGDRLTSVQRPLGTPAAILDDLEDISPSLREETVYVPNLDFETDSDD